MSFSDHFEHAFCVNLERRPDRWKSAQKQFERIGIEVERVDAVDGDKLPPGNLKPGAMGCRASHLNVFNMAAERGLSSFLLLEDDVVFDPDFNEKFNSQEPQIPDNFVMLYIGTNKLSGHANKISDNVFRIFNVLAAHCVIFKEPCYEDIISKLSGAPMYPCDVSYGELQINYPSFAIHPSLAWQKEGFSDIEKVYVDYDFMRD